MSRSLLLLATLMGVVASVQAEPTYKYRVPIQGSAASVPAGQLSVSPPQLSFADLAVGQASNAALVLQNIGQSVVKLNSLTYSGSSSFLIDTSTCPSSLAASQMCAVGVTFAPQSRGEQAGGVTVRFDSSLLQVSLSGRGLQGVLQADAASVVFGPVVAPGVSTQALRIQNTGDASVSGINLSTQSPFAVGSGCNTITPGNSCELTLTFTPSVAGSFTGSLELSSPVGSFGVALSGQGIAQTQSASLSQSLIDFGTVAQGSAPLERSVTVTNTGNSPMSVTAVAGLPAGVSVASNSCSSVQPGANCAISLSLATGTLTEFAASPAQLTGPSNSPALALTGKVAGTQVSVLSGAPVAFGSVVQGQAVPERIVTLSNVGNTPMTLSGLVGLPAGVSLTGNTCSGVVPNGNCALTLQLATAAPITISGATATTQGATTNASFNLTGEVLTAQSVAEIVSGNPVSFGSVVQGAAVVDRVVVLRNAGNSSFTLASFSGLPTGVSIPSNGCSQSISPNATCSVTFRLETATARSFSNVSVSSQGATTNATLSMSGEVVAAQSVPQVDSGSPVSFGSVTQGAAAVSRTVTLSNKGNSPMTLTGLANLPSAVTVTGNTCSSTAPGASCTLTLQMATASVTSFNQTATTQGATTAASIPLSGTVASAVTPVSVTVSAQYAERTAPPNNSGLLVRVTNKTGATLSIVGANFCAGPQNAVLTTYRVSTRTLYNQGGTVNRTLSDNCTMRTFSAVSWPKDTFTLLMWEIPDEYTGVVNSTNTMCANGSCYAELRLSDGRTVRVDDSLQISTY